MFSINIYLRFALIVVLLGGGTALAFAYGFWYAFPFLLIGILLLVGYLLLGTVQSAAAMLQEANFDGAEKRLNLTLTPKLLYPTNRAYFYILKGSIAVTRKDNEEGEKWMKKAQSIKLPTDNEKAMVELQLANLAAGKGKWQQAQMHFRKLKSLKITDSNIKEQYKEFEKAMSQRGQLKAAGHQGQMQRGGKRRRPKMR